MDDQACDIAVALILPSEGLCLRAYPDPGSPLSRALSARNLLGLYKLGRAEIPEDLRGLSGTPWTIGYGETLGIREGMVWTQDKAYIRLRSRVRQFAKGVLSRCPQLFLEPPQRVAACVSLAYNIGLGAFGASSVCRLTKCCEYRRAAESFKPWNKSGGRVMRGLVARRALEAAYYMA